MSRRYEDLKPTAPKNSRFRDDLTHCPHCGASLADDENEPDPVIRWYIPDDAGTPNAAVGAALLGSVRAHGQAVYVSSDNGKTVKRVGVAAAATGERIATEEREPIIVTPEDFARSWRRAGHVTFARPKVRAAGGAQ